MLITTDRPTAFQVAGRAWRSTFLAMRQMAPLFISCLAILLAISFFSRWLQHNPSFKLTPDQESWLKHPSGQLPIALWRSFPMTIFWEIVDAIILAPVAVAVHRFVLLGEVRKGLIFISSATLRFAVLAASLAVLEMALGLFGLGISPFAHTMFNVVYWSCVIWTLLAFPSIAVEEPFGSVARRMDVAIGRVKGNFWLIVRTMLLTVFLIFLAIGLYETIPFLMDPQALQHPQAMMDRYTAWPFEIVMTAAMVLMTALGAAAASWLYSYAISKEPSVIFD